MKGVSRVDSLIQILKKGNVTIYDIEFENALIKKNDEYLTLIEGMHADETLAGVERFLQSLQEANIKMH